MNTFEIKQAAIRNVEQMTGMQIDATNKQHAQLMGMFEAGVRYIAANPSAFFSHLLQHRPGKELIIDVVTTKYGVTLEQLKQRGRSEQVRLPRQVLGTLLHKAGGLTAVAVGKLFSQDHSTVLNSIKVVTNYAHTDEFFKMQYLELLAEINKRASHD